MCCCAAGDAEFVPLANCRRKVKERGSGVLQASVSQVEVKSSFHSSTVSETARQRRLTSPIPDDTLVPLVTTIPALVQSGPSGSHPSSLSHGPIVADVVQDSTSDRPGVSASLPLCPRVLCVMFQSCVELQ